MIEPVYMNYSHEGTMLVDGENSRTKNKAFSMCKNAVKRHSLITSLKAKEDSIIGCFRNKKEDEFP